MWTRGVPASMAALLGVGLAVAVAPAASAAAVPVTCGQLVTTSVVLRADLRCPGAGLVVGADGVRIDLNGHTISGSGAGDGITATGYTGLRITGGTIRDFGWAVRLQDTRGTILAGLRLPANVHGGVFVNHADGVQIRGGSIVGARLVPPLWVRDSARVAIGGLDATGPINLGDTTDSSITDSVFRPAEFDDGIVLSRTPRITVRNNILLRGYIAVNQAPQSSIVDNDISGGGMDFYESDGILIKGNTMRGGRFGLDMLAAPSVDARIVENVFESNQIGLRLSGRHLSDLPGLTIARNTFVGNTAAGMLIETTLPGTTAKPVLVTGNVFHANGFLGGGDDGAGRPIDDGLHVNVPPNSPLVVADNRTRANFDHGIEALPAGSVRDGGGNTSRQDRSGCAGVVCR